MKILQPLKNAFHAATLLWHNHALEALRLENKGLKEENERLALLAHANHVTGFPNKIEFENFLNQKIAEAIRYKERDLDFVVMFIDINHFKAINDNLGHAQGNIALREMAQAIKKSIRQEDTLYHLHGDEFVIIGPHAEGRNLNKEALTQKINAISIKYEKDNKKYTISPSVGIANSAEYLHIYAERIAQETFFTYMIETADAAMYKNKKALKDAARDSNMSTAVLGMP